MKQTAVEKLEMKIVELEKDFAIPHRIYELCEQAKELEKEQIIEACDYGIKLYINDPITGQDYYDATFNQTES